MPELNVLWVDPGERVGWAHGRIDTVTTQLEVVQHGIQPLWTMADLLAGDRVPLVVPRSQGGGYSEWVMPVTDFDVVGYETWRLAADKAKELIGSDMQSSQFIGIVRFLARRANVKLVSQGPKDQHVGRTVAPPSVKACLATLPKSHDESHDGSALCHLSKWWFTNYFDPTVEATNG